MASLLRRSGYEGQERHPQFVIPCSIFVNQIPQLLVCAMSENLRYYFLGSAAFGVRLKRPNLLPHEHRVGYGKANDG
jgi:hypothetical protein